ncbi:hypothetical protein [Bowmanella sp. JS7-9]|uniref:Uncharacterized protein n=1 Tax=Pseudobowmanella zhangzhouensis TaxID=1537679 RepID=A0ABW1XLU4_9ALTE|nr:hypothetical protein [Bowmanella sp. JS7-9]TBX21945.1 hypothetical protein TK45_10685 [Bowmanella sp. JS7-9]
MTMKYENKINLHRAVKEIESLLAHELGLSDASFSLVIGAATEEGSDQKDTLLSLSNAGGRGDTLMLLMAGVAAMSGAGAFESVHEESDVEIDDNVVPFTGGMH